MAAPQATEQTAKRIEMLKLLQLLKRGDEKPGAVVLRALRANADLRKFVDRLAVVFKPPRLHWSGPDIVTIIEREYEAFLIENVHG